MFTAVSRRHPVRPIEELAGPWRAVVARLRQETRGGVRKGAAETGARLTATLVHLRHDLPHGVLGLLFGVGRSTITRVIGEVRPSFAERGCTVGPGERVRTPTEVVDHLGSTGTTGIVDGIETRVRRPAAGRKDRDEFTPGKSKRNAVRTMVVTDENGRVLFCSPTKPGSCADITHARQSGLVKLLADGPA